MLEDKEKVEARRYFLRRRDGTLLVCCGTQEKVVHEAMMLAFQYDEQIDVLMQVGRVFPPAFQEDVYTPI
jgi:hypothetical protein